MTAGTTNFPSRYEEPVKQERLIPCLALCGVLAPWVLVSFMLIAGFVTPEYSHVMHTVSHLGAQGQPYPWVIGAGLVLYGSLVIGTAFGFYRILGAGTASGIMVAALSVHGTSVLFAGVLQDYPMDPNHPVTFAGNLHGYLAYIAFVTLVIGIWAFAQAVQHRQGWRYFSLLSRMTVVLAVAAVLLFFPEPLRPIQGLIQRVFYTFPLIWLELASLQAFQLASWSRAASAPAPESTLGGLRLEPSWQETRREPTASTVK